MWPFRSKPLLEPEMIDWMFEQVDWLLTAHHHRASFANAQFLPLSAKVFSDDGLRGHALAEHLLAQVLRYASAASLPIELVASHESRRYSASGPGPQIAPRPTAAGTYRRRRDLSPLLMMRRCSTLQPTSSRCLLMRSHTPFWISERSGHRRAIPISMKCARI